MKRQAGTAWLVECCHLIDAICRDDVNAVRSLVETNPKLLTEDALVRKSNWGPPLSYAANLGRDAIIEALYEMGARDLEHAMARAVLQSQIGTAVKLHGFMGATAPAQDALAGPAYTLSVSGTELVFRLGGKAIDGSGRRIAPVDIVLETDSRSPAAKRAILQMYADHSSEAAPSRLRSRHSARVPGDHFLVLIAIGCEDDALSIGRPSAVAILSGVGGETADVTSIGIHTEDVPVLVL